MYNKLRLLGERIDHRDMVPKRDFSGELRKAESRSRDSYQFQEQQTDETVHRTIATMLDELDNLKPDETTYLERNLLKKHLKRLMKVATFSNRVMTGLRDEVKEKKELIKTLQETVKQMLAKEDTEKSPISTNAPGTPPSTCRVQVQQMPGKEDSKKSAISTPAPGTPPSACQLCANHDETKRQARQLQDALQSLYTHIIDLMRNNSSRGTSARSSLFNTPRQLRGDLDRPFIWDRETVRRLEEYPKLTRDLEILRRKLDETRQFLAASECQRGGALITVNQLVSEVKRAKERIRVLELRRGRSKTNRGGPRLPKNAALTSTKKDGDQITGTVIPVRHRTTVRRQGRPRDRTTSQLGSAHGAKTQIAWKPTDSA